MADTVTATLGLIKPEPGASSNTWGTKLNSNMDGIDSAINALDTGKSPVGHTHTTANITGLDAALAAKQEVSAKGAANGYASLDAAVKVPIAQMPVALTADVADSMRKAQNLNDVTNKATARTNLDVYAKAEVYAKTEFHAAASKATPVDADEVPLIDSAASWGLKKLTWTDLKATLKAYFDTLYALAAHTHTFASLTGKPTTLAGYGITDVTVAAIPKAWVRFNGTGTVTIVSSFNVSSITDNGAGSYTVNFAAAMADTNFAALITAIGGGTNNIPGAASSSAATTPLTRTTTSVSFETRRASTGSAEDHADINVVIFR